MTIIENPDGVATSKIYNIGNPANNHSVREPPKCCSNWRRNIRNISPRAAKSKLVDTTAEAYYGVGYQDVQDRAPRSPIPWTNSTGCRA